MDAHDKCIGFKLIMLRLLNQLNYTPPNLKLYKKDTCEDANGRLPRKKDIVIVEGTKKDGVVFADTIEIPNVKIYTKLSELKG